LDESKLNGADRKSKAVRLSKPSPDLNVVDWCGVEARHGWIDLGKKTSKTK